MALNLISPTIFTTSVLVADTYKAPGGSTDAIPQLTTSGGLPVSAALELQGTDAALVVNRMTSGERDLMNVTDGMCIYNTTVGAFQFRENGVWNTPGPGGGDVVGPAGAVQNDIAIFADNTGKLLADSGVLITQVPAPAPLLGKTSFAPLADVPQISNFGILSFEGPESIINIDGNVMQFLINDTVNNTLSTVFVDSTFDTPVPTTQSCLVELNSTQGAFVPSRMTTIQKDALTPTEGMIVYDTTIGGLSVYQSGSWQTLAAEGLVSWVVQAADTTMISDVGYIPNNVAIVSFALPTNASVGDMFRIAGFGAGGWEITQNPGQTIHFGNQNTTTGGGGSLASSNSGDSVEIVCVVADTDFVVISSIGNITVS